MKRKFPILFAPVFLAGALVAVGTYWSFTRGGHDFAVFYHAWSLVAHGHGTEIYVNSPDRYLYAPGFAWILAPIAFLPQKLALAVWGLLKASAIFGMMQAFAKRIREKSLQTTRPLSSDAALAIAAGGLILCARPFLIELQYGQVNVLILAVCCWALFSFFDGEKGPVPAASSWIAWFCLGLIATSKVFAFPLLLLPWFRGRAGRNVRAIRLASLAGIVTALFLPVLTLGVPGGLDMLSGWVGALSGKGLPLETHNQSFVALIQHYLTNAPTHVIALGSKWVILGQAVLSASTLTELALAWSFLTGGFLLGWIIYSRKTDTLRWMAVAIGLLFVPSYLVWKPYFVLTYPLAVLMLWRYRQKAWLIGIGFFAMNLSGFDFLGGELAAYLEAASVFLLVHLAYLACVVWGTPDLNQLQASAET